MLKCNHLDNVELSYVEHAKRSLIFAGWAIMMTVVCTIHAVLPWFFTETFSNSVLRLSHKLQEERRKQYEESEDWC